MESVEDYMGAPKGLYELEQLILDLTHASRWSGDLYERDVPYYDKIPAEHARDLSRAPAALPHWRRSKAHLWLRVDVRKQQRNFVRCGVTPIN